MISVVTLAKIGFGIEVLPDLLRRSELNVWLVYKVCPMLEQRVPPITEEVMLKWRLLVEEGRKIGHAFWHPDLSIAATAQHYDLTIVPRATSDFEEALATVSTRGSMPFRVRRNSRISQCV
jgi:predicted nucleic acid-binding protein